MMKLSFVGMVAVIPAVTAAFVRDLNRIDSIQCERQLQKAVSLDRSSRFGVVRPASKLRAKQKSSEKEAEKQYWAGSSASNEQSEQEGSSGAGLLDGYSLSDVMHEEGSAKTEFKPVPSVPGLAAILQGDEGGGTIPSRRYIVPLQPPVKGKKSAQFVMVDVPPYSDKLKEQIITFISNIGSTKKAKTKTPKTNKTTKTVPKKAKREPPTPNQSSVPVAILITNRNSIYYDNAPGVYVRRQSEIHAWSKAFPGIPVVMHRHDAPRDILSPKPKDSNVVNLQLLDGYGPWGWNHTSHQFEEMGQKLVVLDWDDDKIARLYGGEGDDANVNGTLAAMKEAGMDPDQPLANVRENEEGKSILAVYSPGHTAGSLCYVFPETEICATGNTIPEYRARQRLDDEGLVSTNRAGLQRQVESATKLAKEYTDRFRYMLPSKGSKEDGGLVEVEGTTFEARKDFVMEIVNQFDRVTRKYREMGIFGP